MPRQGTGVCSCKIMCYTPQIEAKMGVLTGENTDTRSSQEVSHPGTNCLGMHVFFDVGRCGITLTDTPPRLVVAEEATGDAGRRARCSGCGG